MELWAINVPSLVKNFHKNSLFKFVYLYICTNLQYSHRYTNKWQCERPGLAQALAYYLQVVLAYYTYMNTGSFTVKTGWGSVCSVGALHRVIDMCLEDDLPLAPGTGVFVDARTLCGQGKEPATRHH